MSFPFMCADIKKQNATSVEELWKQVGEPSSERVTVIKRGHGGGEQEESKLCLGPSVMESLH